MSKIDDLFFDAERVELSKTGIAQLVLDLSSAKEQLQILIWTSNVGSIEIRVEERQPWVDVMVDSQSNVVGLAAGPCMAHLEHLDRGHYFFSLTAGDGTELRAFLSSQGYIKTKSAKLPE